MEARTICSCGAGSWAKVIAWLQIVANAIAVSYTVYVLVIVIYLGPEGLAKVAIAKVLGYEAAYPVFITFLVISLIVFNIAIVMGIILLIGSKEQNTRYLHWWLIYAGVYMVWELITAISHGSIALIIVHVLIVLLLYGFGIWIVRVHIQEIERDITGF